MQMDVGMMGCLDLWAIVPELILAGLALLLVPVAGLARGRWRGVPAGVAALGLVAALGFTVRMLAWPPQAVFCGTYAVDGFGTTFKLLIELGALVSLLAIAAHFRGTVQEAHAPVALLFATVGGVLLVSSLDLGLIVLFLQMLSMGSYILVSLVRRDRRANEATLKFFIYAAVALAVMAYGLSFLFGLTGSLELRAIGQALAGADPVWVAVAFGLVVIGYAFEVTVVPFHFWAPDVYDGATAPVAGVLSVVPKIAGFGALLRFLLVALPGGLAAWPLVIAVLAALTMTLGNLAALRQTHLKRLLAYSSIAQAGYVLMVVAVAGRADSALSAAGFYLAAYLFMNLGAFVVTAQLERLTGSDRVAGLRGLGRTHRLGLFDGDVLAGLGAEVLDFGPHGAQIVRCADRRVPDRADGADHPAGKVAHAKAPQPQQHHAHQYPGDGGLALAAHAGHGEPFVCSAAALDQAWRVSGPACLGPARPAGKVGRGGAAKGRQARAQRLDPVRIGIGKRDADMARADRIILGHEHGARQKQHPCLAHQARLEVEPMPALKVRLEKTLAATPAGLPDGTVPPVTVPGGLPDGTVPPAGAPVKDTLPTRP